MLNHDPDNPVDVLIADAMEAAAAGAGGVDHTVVLNEAAMLLAPMAQGGPLSPAANPSGGPVVLGFVAPAMGNVLVFTP